MTIIVKFHTLLSQVYDNLCKYAESTKSKNCPEAETKEMAGGQGFEPRQAESESAVLPLDDPPALWN